MGLATTGLHLRRLLDNDIVLDVELVVHIHNVDLY